MRLHSLIAACTLSALVLATPAAASSLTPIKDFDIGGGRKTRHVVLFQQDRESSAEDTKYPDLPPAIERGADGDSALRMPFSVGTYIGVFPLPYALSKGIELTVPLFFWGSLVARAEGVWGGWIDGFMFDVGTRLSIPLPAHNWIIPPSFSRVWCLNFDIALRLGSVRYDPAHFDEPKETGHASAGGPVVRAGFDVGADAVRFFANVTGALFLFRTEQDRRVVQPAVGIEAGVRIFLG